MKVKIEMIIEVSKEIDCWDIESHIQDALDGYQGNDIKFYSCDVMECKPVLKRFNKEHAGKTFECIEGFKATHTNVVAGKTVSNEQTFIAGFTYDTKSWRPKGILIDNFWVFNKDANKFIIANTS